MELESIRRAIEDEEALLAQLDRERQNVLDRLQVLHTQLRAALPTDTLPPEKHSLPGITPATADEKVTLFRDLFRGREDVYPKFWRNEKTGRSGYSPACANEWVRGVCEKPRVKCGECPSRSFLPVTDQVILDHLQGRHVIGVYPLLPDESCRFLAVDFDKLSWQEDVAAFLETCRADGIAACLERSRSGNGARVWFFFEDPVPATVARKMGCFLITETMDRLAAIPEDEERLILATGRYIGEGFDDARLDTLFLALPVSWKGTLVQYAGRLHRLHPGKREVQIYDYVDRNVPMLARMFEKRLRGYRAIGYSE